MKALYTFLLLLSAIIGQAQTGFTEAEIYQIENEFFVDVSTPHRPFVWIGGCINLIDLIEYETECFNDSTLVEVHHVEELNITDWFSIGGGACMWPRCPESHYRNVWIHRQPTFDGFISWIKNRIK